MSATADRTATAVMTYREALRLALREELARDDRVFLMGEEVGLVDGSYKVTAGLLDEFGAERVRDTPISEEGFVGAGVGAAMLGERPVVEIMTMNFLLVAMDQVVNHAAKVGAMFGGELRCPLVIRTPNGAGNQLTAQHSQSFDGWFAATPGLKVVAPASAADAKGPLKATIRDDDPVLVIENLRIYTEKGAVLLHPDHTTPIGPGPRRAAGQRHHDPRPRVRDSPRARRRGATGDQRRGRRGGRPALAAAAGRRNGRRIGGEDQPSALCRGGLAELRGQRRTGRPHPEGVLRRPRRARRARWHGRGAASLRQEPRAGGDADRAADRGRGAAHPGARARPRTEVEPTR
jgi:hypothetical protein